MSQFRAKKLDIGCYVNTRIVRDHTKRKMVMKFEPERQALRYIIRNLSLSARTRAQAQLQLTQMHCYTRPTQVNNRCIMAGKGRGILSDFGMSRVCHPGDQFLPDSSTGYVNANDTSQYQFRMQALAGMLPGVKKASW